MFREIREIKSEDIRKKKEKEFLPYMAIKPSDDFKMTDEEINNFWKEVFSGK